MSETAQGYLPDFFVKAMPDVPEVHSTEVLRGRAGGRQAAARFRVGGYKQIVAQSVPLLQPERLALRAFLSAKRGRFTPFYVWHPNAQLREGFACGTVTAAARFVVPFKITGAIGGGAPLAAIKGSITDVRVGGVSRSFNRISLLPKAGTYATLRMYGSAAAVNCGADSTLRPTGDMSVTAWIYVVSFAALPYIIGSHNSVTSGFGFHVDATGHLRFFTSNAGVVSTALSTGTVPLGVWTHVTASRSAGTVSFYINAVASGSGAVSNPATPTLSFFVGSNPLASNAMDGMISDVRFYDSAISAGEVTNIKNGSATPTANLRGWWRLQEGYGTATADLSGYGNNGTLSGAPSPLWVSGEEEIIFSGGAQTGVVTAWGTFRERLLMAYASDTIGESYWAESSDPYAIVNLPLEEV